MEILTGTKKVSADPLLEYFEPLYKFLKAENEKAEPTVRVNIFVLFLTHIRPRAFSRDKLALTSENPIANVTVDGNNSVSSR